MGSYVSHCQKSSWAMDAMRMRVLWPIIESAKENVRKAFQLGIKVAPGSDAGAYRVLHGQGIQDEMDSFVEFLEEEKRDDVYRWLAEGEAEIKKKFMRLLAC